MNISRIRSQWKSSWRYVKNAACIKREYIWSKLDKFPFFFFFSKNLVSTFQRESACRGKFCIFIHFTSIKLRLLFESALPLRIDWNTRKYRPRKIGGRCLRCVKFLIFEGIQLALENKSYSKNSENQDWCTKGQEFLCSKISKHTRINLLNVY